MAYDPLHVATNSNAAQDDRIIKNATMFFQSLRDSVDGIRNKTKTLAVLFLSLGACHGQSTPYYRVGGTVAGLSGVGLVLQINGSDNLSTSANGAFSFSAYVPAGSSYTVTVLGQPTNPIQNCVVLNGTGAGSVVQADITSVRVHCTDVGQFVYVNNNGHDGTVVSHGFPASSVAGYILDGVSGALRPVFGSPMVYSYYWAESFAIDPSGRTAYVVGQGSYALAGFSGISVAQIDQVSGVFRGSNGLNILIPLSSTCCDNGLVAIVDPLNRFLFVSSSLGIFVYGIDRATGALTAVAGSPFFPPSANSKTGAVAIDPAGKYFYVLTSGTYGVSPSGIAAYRINESTGSLSSVAGSPFPAGSIATSIVIDPTGKFVYVTSVPYAPSIQDTVTAYKLIDSSGALSQIQGSPFAVSGAVSITFHPSGGYAYVLGYTGAVTKFAVDSTTGELRNGMAIVPAYPTSGNRPAVTGPFAEAAASDPSGKFLFISSIGPADFEIAPFIPNRISIYVIDANSGALAESSDSPFEAPFVENPTSVGPIIVTR